MVKQPERSPPGGWRRPSVFLLYALLTGVIALAVLGPSVYLRVRRDVIEARVISQTELLRMARDTLSLALQQLDSATTQLVLDGALSSLPRLHSERNFLLVRAVQERLAGFLTLYPAVAQIAIIYPNEDVYYDPRIGLQPLGQYPSPDILADLASRRAPARRYQVASVAVDGTRRPTLTLVKSIPLIHFAPQAYLVLVIGDGLVGATLDRLEQMGSYQIGLFADHRLLAGVRLTAPADVAELLSERQQNGIVTIDGSRFVAASTSPDSNTLSLISLVEADRALAQLRGLSAFFSAVVLVALVGVVVVGLWSAERLERPLVLIARALNGPDETVRVDADLINRKVVSMVRQSGRLREEIARYAPVMTDRKVRRVVTRGGPQTAEIIDELQLNQIDDQPVATAVVLLLHAMVVRHVTRHETVETDPLPVVREILRSLKPQYTWQAVDYADTSILLLCRDTGEIDPVVVRKVALALIQGMDQLGVRASAGIGSVVPGVADALESFRVAQRLADIARVRGEASVLSADDLELPDGSTYPYEQEARVTGAVRDGDPEGAVAATEQFVAELPRQSVLATQAALVRLAGAVDSVLHDQGERLSDPAHDSELFARLMQSSTIADMTALLADAYHGAAGRLAAARDTRHDALVQKVRHIVREQLDQDLSLHRLAQQVYLSESYLSRLFRETTGEQLRTYIVRLRMEHAAALLTDTTLPIGEVGLRVGYDRLQSFAKTFKREMGVTPSDFRRARAVRGAT